MILIYHHVAPCRAVPASPDPSEGWDFRHSPEAFAHHLDSLRQHGYRFTSLDELVRSICDHGREPPRSVQITFDVAGATTIATHSRCCASAA